MSPRAKVPDTWRCPQCKAPTHKHGSGECLARGTDCEGLICECYVETNAKTHGYSDDDPCPNAACYHCGWGGTVPPPPFDPAKLKGWAKTAWAAGWRPPAGWTP